MDNQGILQMDTSFYDPGADLFFDIKEINKIRNWMGVENIGDLDLQILNKHFI